MPSTRPVSLEILPWEILSQCCQYLTRTFQPSLFAFSLASKHCRAAACAWIFRKIRISVTGADCLQHEVETCIRVLKAARSLLNVRILEIEGHMCYTGSTTPRDGPPRDWTTHWLRKYDSNDPFSEPSFTVGDKLDFATEAVVLQHDEWWKPLAHLITQLPELRDFIYAGLNPLSPCLLEALEQHEPPYCRLHHLSFCLQSAITRNPAASLDLFDLKLATSPCLYSILLRHDEYACGGLQNFNEEIVMHLASGVAPNLKRVKTEWESPGASKDLIEATARPRFPWKGFEMETFRRNEGDDNDDDDDHTRKRGRLTCLDLFDYYPVSRDTVQRWSSYVDFSALRTLKLRGDIQAKTMTYLATNAADLSSLTTLVLVIHCNDNDYIWTDKYNTDLASLFSKLHPLRVLKVSDGLSILTLSSMLARHGRSLRRLHLSPYERERSRIQSCTITAETISTLVEACPLLEDLLISIPRSKGGGEEIKYYRNLGRFPRLQSLALVLDCSNVSVLSDIYLDVAASDPSFDKEDEEIVELVGWVSPRNGHLRDAMINSAVDESLARQIFQVVSESKPRGALPLSSLEVSVTGGWRLGSPGNLLTDLEHLLRTLGRSWVCRRLNPQHRQGVSVEELNKRRRKMIEAYLGKRLVGRLEKVFRRIWPTIGEAGDWREDWRSFPLSL